MAVSYIRLNAPHSATYTNGNSASVMKVKTNISNVGASFIITINRRGNFHSVHQAVVGLTTGNADLVMTAGTAFTAAIATDGFTVNVPSYSNVWVTGSQPFTLETVTT